jgi:hypothetical protein
MRQVLYCSDEDKTSRISGDKTYIVIENWTPLLENILAIRSFQLTILVTQTTN